MRIFTKILLFLVLSFVFIEMPLVQSKAYAGMISTQVAVEDLTKDRNQIKDFVQRDEVKKELIKYGVTADEAARRIASLSDKEVKDLSAQINHAQAGGILVAILIIVLIIILIKKI